MFVIALNQTIEVNGKRVSSKSDYIVDTEKEKDALLKAFDSKVINVDNAIQWREIK